MSNYLTTPENAERQWQALCAKSGQTEAMRIGNEIISGMRTNDAHELRKTARRAVNAIQNGLKNSDYDNNTTDGLMFAANVIKMTTEVIERNQDAEHFMGKRPDNQIFRNVADVQKHYDLRSRNGDASDINLTNMLRGVAGMRTSDGINNAMAAGTDTAGGFAVPDLVMGPILSALMEQSALMRAGVGIKLIEDGHKSLTYPAIDEIPTASWRAEGGAVAESNPTMRGVVTIPHSLAFIIKVSREVLADAMNLESALVQSAAQATSKALDNAGLLGSGTAPEPRGLVNIAGVNTVSMGTDGALLGDYVPFLSASGKLLEQGVTPNAAILSIRDRMTLAGLEDTTGQPLNVPPYLSSMSFVPSAQLPTNLVVGTSGAKCAQAIVGDFSTVHWVMREAMSVQLLREAFAGNGQLGFVVHVRADLAVTYPKAIAVISGIKGA